MEIIFIFADFSFHIHVRVTFRVLLRGQADFPSFARYYHGDVPLLLNYGNGAIAISLTAEFQVRDLSLIYDENTKHTSKP